jgi:hypothetical protein
MKTSTIAVDDSVIARPKYYEMDGALRANANRAWLLAFLTIPIALVAIGFAVFVRLQPPTVIRIGPNGDASVLGKPAKGAVTAQERLWEYQQLRAGRRCLMASLLDLLQGRRGIKQHTPYLCDGSSNHDFMLNADIRKMRTLVEGLRTSFEDFRSDGQTRTSDVGRRPRRSLPLTFPIASKLPTARLIRFILAVPITALIFSSSPLRDLHQKVQIQGDSQEASL